MMAVLWKPLFRFAHRTIWVYGIDPLCLEARAAYYCVGVDPRVTGAILLRSLNPLGEPAGPTLCLKVMSDSGTWIHRVELTGEPPEMEKA